MRVIIFLAFILLSVSSVTAEEFFAFKAGDKVVTLALPEGFCEKTDTPNGKTYASLIGSLMDAAGLSEVVLAGVILPCDEASFERYPWGWVGYLPDDLKGVTQTMFNEYMAEQGLDLIAPLINDRINSKEFTDEAEQSTGHIFENKAGKPIIYDMNKDHILLVTPLEGALDGKRVREVNLTSSRIRNGTMVYVYTYELQGNTAGVGSLIKGMLKIRKEIFIK